MKKKTKNVLQTKRETETKLQRVIGLLSSFTTRSPLPPLRTNTCCFGLWSDAWIHSYCPSTLLNSVCPACWAPGSKGGAPGPALTNPPGLCCTRAQTPGSLWAHLTNCSLRDDKKNIQSNCLAPPPPPTMFYIYFTPKTLKLPNEYQQMRAYLEGSGGSKVEMPLSGTSGCSEVQLLSPMGSRRCLGSRGTDRKVDTWGWKQKLRSNIKIHIGFKPDWLSLSSEQSQTK